MISSLHDERFSDSSSRSAPRGSRVISMLTGLLLLLSPAIPFSRPPIDVMAGDIEVGFISSKDDDVSFPGLSCPLGRGVDHRCSALQLRQRRIAELAPAHTRVRAGISPLLVLAKNPSSVFCTQVTSVLSTSGTSKYRLTLRR